MTLRSLWRIWSHGQPGLPATALQRAVASTDVSCSFKENEMQSDLIQQDLDDEFAIRELTEEEVQLVAGGMMLFRSVF
jgi:hypothetical protein